MNLTGPKLAILLSSVAVLTVFVALCDPQPARGDLNPKPPVPTPMSDRIRSSTGKSTLPSKGSKTEANLREPIIFVQAPVVAQGDLVSRFPEGSHLAVLAPGTKTPSNLTPEFFAAADPAISFDGTQVLFAALDQPAGTWQVWQMKTDGSGKRQITHSAVNCLRPAYMAQGHFTFSGVESDGSSQIHFGNLDGTEEHPITFGPGNFLVETVLKDGRILASADSPLVSGEQNRFLYTLRHDGTSLHSLRCDHRQLARRGDASEMPDGTVVFVKSKAGNPDGELAMIRRGATSNSVLGKFTTGMLSPFPLTSEKLVVARQSIAQSAPAGRFDLYAVDSVTGRQDELIFRDAKLSSVQAVPVAAHAVPRWFWSTLNPKAKSGYLICLDAYHSADAPQGRIATPISKLRVLTLDPATNTERVLGIAPVESDGSFYIAVPPDQPVRFELLDNGGAVIQAQKSWIWSRRGEERGCVGCHEDKSIAPDNRWPLTLRRFDTPTPLGTVVDVKVEK